MGDGAFEERGARGAAAARRRAGARTRRASKLRVAATVSADAVGLLAASVLAVWIVATFDDVPLIRQLHGAFESDPPVGVLLFALLTPYWLAALWAFGLYREPGRSIGGFNLGEGMAGLTALTSASWLLLIVLVLALGDQAPVVPLIAFWSIAVLVVPLARWIGRTTIWARPSFQERVLIIGAGEVGHTVAAKIAGHPEYRIDLIGFLDDGEPRHNGHEGPPLPVIGALSDLDAIVAGERVDRVIVAFSRARHNDFLRVVRACADSGVQGQHRAAPVRGRELAGARRRRRGHPAARRRQRRAQPLQHGRQAGVRPRRRRPALHPGAAVHGHRRGHHQARLARPGVLPAGAHGARRQAVPDLQVPHHARGRGRASASSWPRRQNDYDGPMFKLKEDPRITRVGGALRRWSIDELPQILNVMKGDMSLVGPRPLWVEEAKQCRGWTQKRLDITPGITGLWQVLGRSNIPFDEMVKLDYMYVTGWSLSWDIKLLLQTVPAVLNRRGAY